MHILITGGAGYIGTKLVDLLALNPLVKKITVYDNLSRPNFNLFLAGRGPGSEKIQFIKGELLDSRKLKAALQGVHVVYHLAARATTPFGNADAHLYEQINHWGTAELVYALEESPVQRLIYTSSAGVYGSGEQEVDESAQPDPKTFYGISKLRGEEHVRRLMPRIPTFVFRCGNVYGYNRSMRFDAVINKFVFEANFERRITIHGNGEQARSFISIDSVGHALANALTTSLPGGVYNLTERSLKIMDVVDALKQHIPDLEFILINQHMKLSNLNIKVNREVNQALGIGNLKPFEAEVISFLEKFSF